MNKRNNGEQPDNTPVEPSSDTPIELTDAQKQAMILDMQLSAARMNFEAAQINLNKAQAQGENLPSTNAASIEYETALMRRDITMHEIEEFRRKQDEKRSNQLAALHNMEQERLTREAIQAVCQHRCGGNGYEDFYRGGHKEPHSMIKAELPIAGMALIMCVRCFDEVITPDRNLLHRRASDSDETYDERKAEYARQMEKFNRFEEMYRDSYNPVVMSGPKFQFEKDGIPIHPVRI